MYISQLAGLPSSQAFTSAVLAGLLLTVAFCMSHSTVEVEVTEWVEPVILWISICVPTDSGKSALCKFLRSLVTKAQVSCDLTECDPSWWTDDQSFEKMGNVREPLETTWVA